MAKIGQESLKTEMTRVVMKKIWTKVVKDTQSQIAIAKEKIPG